MQEAENKPLVKHAITPVHFESFELDISTRILSFKGQPVAIGDRALDLLSILVKRAGQVVPKDELIAAAWPSVFVHEANLRVHISALQRALSVLQNGRRLIVNVVGRGYSFVGQIGPGAGANSGQNSVAAEASSNIPGETPRNNLPQPLNRLIGRESELTTLTLYLAQHRLITLAGPGGIGKTRLAIELGQRSLSGFPGGVWLVDLAAVVNPDAIADAVASVLGATTQGDSSALDALVATIGWQRMLLILDNCEYYVNAVAVLIEALHPRTPHLSILATSQEILKASAEHVFRLGPLAIPPIESTDIADFSAVVLLVERAQSADNRFTLTDLNAKTIADICRRLNGIPLALEIVAGRFAMLGVERVHEQLDRLFLTVLGRRTSAQRHRTIHNMVKWSLGLLDDGDQIVFRNLAVFSGSFSLEAAMKVAGSDGDEWNVVDALGRLIDKSLLAIEGQEPPRYRLLETLRSIAIAMLEASGQSTAIFERHALYLANFFRDAEKAQSNMPISEWVALYGLELENTRAAINWALAKPDRAQSAVRLVAFADKLFSRLQYEAERRRVIDQVLPLIDASTPLESSARLTRAAGQIWVNSDQPRALALLQRAAALYHELGDSYNLAHTDTDIGNMLYYLGRYAEAKATFEEAQRIFTQQGIPIFLIRVFYGLGRIATDTNDLAEARRCFMRAIELAQSHKDLLLELYNLIELSAVAFITGDVERAIAMGEDIVARLRPVKPRIILDSTLINLGIFLTAENRFAEAYDCALEALAETEALGDELIRECLEVLAVLYATSRQFRAGAQLAGFASKRTQNASKNERNPATYINNRLSLLLKEGLPHAELLDCTEIGREWNDTEAMRFVESHPVQGIARPIRLKVE